MSQKMTGKKPFDRFEDVAASPFYWWVTASDLYASAAAVLEAWKLAKEQYFGPIGAENGAVRLTVSQQAASMRLRLNKVYLFLAGLALENLLKSLLVVRDPSVIRGNKINVGRGNKAHSLVNLCERLNIDLAPAEVELLGRLSDIVAWAGRYPVPLYASDWNLQQLASGGAFMPGMFKSDDEAQVDAIWKRVCGIIDSDRSVPKFRGMPPEVRD